MGLVHSILFEREVLSLAVYPLYGGFNSAGAESEVFGV